MTKYLLILSLVFGFFSIIVLSPLLYFISILIFLLNSSLYVGILFVHLVVTNNSISDLELKFYQLLHMY